MRKPRRINSRRDHGQRGDILVIFLIAMVPTLLTIGLAVDLGSAYLAQSGLANAVDAGALAAARSTSAPDTQAVALRVAKQNYNIGNSVTYTYTSTTLSNNGIKIEVEGQFESPAYFSKLFGNTGFDVHAQATAVRYPLDLTLVIDNSNSLLPSSVWTTLKDETKDFLDYFEEWTDRIGIVSFDTLAIEEMPMRDDFSIAGDQAINNMDTLEDTNMGDALQLAKAQLDVLAVRPESKRYVVVVTDGRPNAFSGNIGVPSAPTGTYSGIGATKNTSFGVRGLFSLADGDKLVGYDAGSNPLYESNGSSTASPAISVLPFGLAPTDTNIRALGTLTTEFYANQIRASDVTIYVVGILPPSPPFPLDTPDLEMLRRVANEGGMSSSTQPQGEVLWSGPEDLDDMLEEIAAKMLLTSLTDG